jgi:hypothetical protein
MWQPTSIYLLCDGEGGGDWVDLGGIVIPLKWLAGNVPLKLCKCARGMRPKGMAA